MDWLGEAVATTASVAVVSSFARVAGSRCAGILAALPTTTAPALLWLALERGAAAASRAAIACVGAGAVLATFAFAYAMAAQRRSVPVALCLACGAAVLAALPACAFAGSVGASFALASSAAAFAARHLRSTPRPRTASCGEATVARTMALALAAGFLAALAAALEPLLGAVGSGLAASLPVCSAAIAAAEHAARGPAGAQDFLRAYVAGLPARAVFALVFALSVSPCGAAAATVMAASACLGMLILSSGQPRARPDVARRALRKAAPVIPGVGRLPARWAWRLSFRRFVAGRSGEWGR